MEGILVHHIPMKLIRNSFRIKVNKGTTIDPKKVQSQEENIDCQFHKFNQFHRFLGQ